VIARRTALAGALAALATPAAVPVFGQQQTPSDGGWRPTRPITIVVPFAAGSGTDAVARILGQLLGEELGGANVVIDNKPGANGSIAAIQVVRAAPDGHTLFSGTNTTHSANPSLLRQMSYDPVEDFTPISRVGNNIFMLVVGEPVRASTVRELLALARAQPGEVSYASGNSTGIVAGATMARMGGVEMLHVPYRSTPQAMTDVMAGRVTCMFVDIAAGQGNVRAGKLRTLAVTTRERSTLLPEVPSMHEAGLQGFDITSWNGVFGPARMPPEIVATLNAAIRRSLDRPGVTQRFAEAGFEAFASTPQELDGYVRAEIVRWRELIEAAGIEKE
jgi:tripartite-type tricarboxylate transporter receptor subunit TctC